MSGDQSVEQPDSIVTRLIEQFKDDPEYLQGRITDLEDELRLAQEREQALMAALRSIAQHDYGPAPDELAIAALRAVGALEGPHAS